MRYAPQQDGDDDLNRHDRATKDGPQAQSHVRNADEPAHIIGRIERSAAEQYGTFDRGGLKARCRRPRT